MSKGRCIHKCPFVFVIRSFLLQAYQVMVMPKKVHTQSGGRCPLLSLQCTSLSLLLLGVSRIVNSNVIDLTKR